MLNKRNGMRRQLPTSCLISLKINFSKPHNNIGLFIGISYKILFGGILKDVLHHVFAIVQMLSMF